jgi:hypothetical protein
VERIGRMIEMKHLRTNAVATIVVDEVFGISNLQSYITLARKNLLNISHFLTSASSLLSGMYSICAHSVSAIGS